MTSHVPADTGGMRSSTGQGGPATASDPGGFELPALWSPMAFEVNSETQAMADAVGRWLQATGTSPDPEHAAIMGAVGAHATAITVPCATGLHARTVSRYMAWGFALDDVWDRAGETEENLHRHIRQTTRMVEILDAPELLTSQDDAWVRSFADIASDFHALALPAPLHRTISGFRAYAFSAVHEAVLQHTATLPRLADYLTFRYASGAGEACASMVEFSTGQDIPAAEILSPLGRAASQTAMTVALLDNELLSRRKESAREEYDCGLIRVLQHEHPDLTLQDAVHAAIAIRDAVLESFLGIRGKLQPGASPPMRIYLEALSHFIAGVTAYMPTSARYTTPGTPAPEPQHTGPHPRWQPPPLPQLLHWNQLAH